MVNIGTPIIFTVNVGTPIFTVDMVMGSPYQLYGTVDHSLPGETTLPLALLFYLKFGLIESPRNSQLPLFLLYENVFSNEVMKPSRLRNILQQWILTKPAGV